MAAGFTGFAAFAAPAAAPASSGSGSGGGGGGGAGTPRRGGAGGIVAAAASASPVYNGADAALGVALKKLAKRDATTKLKALGDCVALLGERGGDAATDALPCVRALALAVPQQRVRRSG